MPTNLSLQTQVRFDLNQNINTSEQKTKGSSFLRGIKSLFSKNKTATDSSINNAEKKLGTQKSGGENAAAHVATMSNQTVNIRSPIPTSFTLPPTDMPPPPPKPPAYTKFDMNLPPPAYSATDPNPKLGGEKKSAHVPVQNSAINNQLSVSTHTALSASLTKNMSLSPNSKLDSSKSEKAINLAPQKENNESLTDIKLSEKEVIFYTKNLKNSLVDGLKSHLENNSAEVIKDPQLNKKSKNTNTETLNKFSQELENLFAKADIQNKKSNQKKSGEIIKDSLFLKQLKNAYDQMSPEKKLIFRNHTEQLGLQTSFILGDDSKKILSDALQEELVDLSEDEVEAAAIILELQKDSMTNNKIQTSDPHIKNMNNILNEYALDDVSGLDELEQELKDLGH
jgi:hypothetical protein